MAYGNIEQTRMAFEEVYQRPEKRWIPTEKMQKHLSRDCSIQLLQNFIHKEIFIKI